MTIATPTQVAHVNFYELDPGTSEVAVVALDDGLEVLSLAEALLAMMRGDEPPSREVLIPHELVERESTLG